MKNPPPVPALPPPPPELSAHTRTLWASVMLSHELSDAELEVLRSGLAALDRADAAAAQLAVDGLTTTDRYGAIRAHPLIDTELRARTLYCRLVRQLGVELTPGAVRRGRPGGSTSGQA